ncbi:MAG: CRISPR-associated helicase Cas3' [Chlorobi bacterium]|nr:CRISPR-associated helicase Cas3' [Chlorobiota bacterium]
MILAKSNPKSTLQEHINDALQIANVLKQSFTNITSLIPEEEFWELLRISIIFHDLGKSHNEFQKILQGQTNNSWNSQRHELFSLPFVKALNIKNKDLIYNVVAGHHKDYEKLIEKLNEYGEDDDFDLDGIEEILTFEKAFKQNIPVKDVTSILSEYEIQISEPIIHNPKRILQQFKQKSFTDYSELIKLLLLAGAFKQCDHLASAGIREIKHLEISDFQYLYETDYDFYTHQQKSSKIIGNAILTAPTGSGKTESSLLWLQNQLKKTGNGRVFYILPFTASINAMYERLNNDIPEKVGLVHGKLSAFIENKFKDDDLIDEQKKKEIKDQFKNLITPLKVVTPFQLLKNIFALRGFEKGIFEWAGGYFIFDEIHAYNPSVFAQIIVLLEFTTKYLNVKAFIMTATLPKFIRNELENAIGDFETVKADNALYENFKRHRIIVKNGKLNENLQLIQNALSEEKKVLLVCNTVKQAQNIYKSLESKNKVLLHSSFNAFDRNKKEKLVFNENTKLLVGTQAIEVSLDIDYDIIFTEPAPLDALIQRFGRVNRKRKKSISDCIVFEGRNKSDKFIYKNKGVIDRTIQILKEKEQINSGKINEAELQEMIDFVYPEWDKTDKDEFDLIYNLLDNFIKKELKPFIYNSKQEEDFYNQFDGVKVLPIKFSDVYQKYLQENKFVKAESLKVQISEKRFHLLNYKNGIEKERTVFESIRTEKILEQQFFTISKKYDSELGLLIDEDEDVFFDNNQYI